tara:strand:- start:274 stop:1635 length:1362 start_codon:yes stop_codon:yes gene_type:complete
MLNKDFSKFGKHFQENLVQIMFEDRAFCDQVGEVFKVEFLEQKYLQQFVEKLFDYKEKYQTHPSSQAIATILRTELDESNQVLTKQVREFFARIHANPSVEDEEYVKHTSLDFCRKQKLKEALMKSANLLQKASFDEISVLINEALKLGSDNSYGYDYKLDFEKRFVLKQRNPVTTGWDLIDKISKGGLGQGELGVVIAPTGAGKSMALVHLGTQGLINGKTVVHFTLELADTVVASRYDSCMTGIHLKDLYSRKEEIYDEVKEVKGNVIVKEYPTKSASVTTLRNHLTKLQNRGIDVGMIIVDYADLLKPTGNYKEKRIELESIYENLRGLSQEFQCPIWTASQTNRGGLNAEVITMESISEAFNKCFVADFIFTLSRTIEDKNVNAARMFVAKNRNGPDGLVYPMRMDTSNVLLEVLEPDGNSIQEINKDAAKNQKQRLADIYKKFKKENN